MKRTPLSRNTIVLAEIGPPCPRCRQPTEVRAHKEITDRELRRAPLSLQVVPMLLQPGLPHGQINDNAYLVHPRRTHFKLSPKRRSDWACPRFIPRRRAPTVPIGKRSWTPMKHHSDPPHPVYSGEERWELEQLGGVPRHSPLRFGPDCPFEFSI